VTSRRTIIAAAPTRGRAPLLGLVLGLVLLAACAGPTRVADVDAGAPGSTVVGPPTLALLGDSISEQSSEELSAAAARHGLRARVDATAGFMTREKQEGAAAVAADHPTIAVMALGTNDAVCMLTNTLFAGSCRYPGFTTADMDADLGTMAETLDSSGACVVGVNAFFGEEVGARLDTLLADGVLDGIVDWRSIVTTDESLRADGIGHLTARGEQVYAETVVTEALRICGPID
jgi:hypothetical protein